MAKMGSADSDQLKKFREDLEKLNAKQTDEFCRACAKVLAARLLAKVIKRTPVGQYPEGSGKVGGTLRRGWTGEKSSSAASFAKSLEVRKVGSMYEIEIINPVEYASYVEFGHRTRNHSGWVPGQFMMTISEKEIQTIAPKVLEAKLNKFLGEVFK